MKNKEDGKELVPLWIRFERLNECYLKLVERKFFTTGGKYCCPMCDREYEKRMYCVCGEYTILKKDYQKKLRDKLYKLKKGL